MGEGGRGRTMGARLIEKKRYEGKFCCNFLIEASDNFLNQKFNNPIKMLTSVKLMFY